jgi:hypothetical protein
MSLPAVAASDSDMAAAAAKAAVAPSILTKKPVPVCSTFTPRVSEKCQQSTTKRLKDRKLPLALQTIFGEEFPRALEESTPPAEHAPPPLLLSSAGKTTTLLPPHEFKPSRMPSVAAIFDRGTPSNSDGANTSAHTQRPAQEQQQQQQQQQHQQRRRRQSTAIDPPGTATEKFSRSVHEILARVVPEPASQRFQVAVTKAMVRK